MSANQGTDWQTGFSPELATWFARAIGEPTPVQRQAWPAIRSGEDVLVAAPTGSGKTLAAFLCAIDALSLQARENALAEACQVLYVSPLKALSNDIQRNLQAPLMGLADAQLEQGRDLVEIRAAVRTGDTPASERERMRRVPPHILVTTPESLFILLTSESGRGMLRTVRTVIVDEIHALAPNKRGAHLALSLARLDALCARPPQRIGLSATQRPLTAVAQFLNGGRPCRIIDGGHGRERDLQMVVPESPLTAVMANEVWAEVYDGIAALARDHRTTLLFVNTRRLAERAARHLGERLGETAVAAHHGSMAKAHRLDAEQKLKAGQLRLLVATASMELGIDIGDVDLVCQIGSPRGINTLVQRVGRSGHAVRATPKGRLFPTTLDELCECTALLAAVRQGELDALCVGDGALDVLAQQIVAELACREWPERELLACLRTAWPYRDLGEPRYQQLLRMLAEGYTARRGRRGAYLHHDRVNGQLRARRNARLVALTNAGVIPDQFDYDVILSPQGFKVGTLNEDFAFESLPGDIFQLGNQSYRILKQESGRLLVEDANGLPPTIPFWVGEAPGRSDELSRAVSRLRAAVAERLDSGLDATAQWLCTEHALPRAAAEQLADYLAAGRAALGCMPTQDCVVFERFFDETGDMHLVIHSPFGSRINRAWGLALRKRFCRKFNFELQAAALEDSIVLSLGITHSFPLDEVAGYLRADTVRPVLEQALLDAPMFPTRWRWVASIALAVRRHLGDRKAPPVWQRNDAEDLMAVVFPDQIACLENLSGPREIPDHPLVTQAMRDCLHEVMDLHGLEDLLRRLESGDLQVHCADLSAPSPLAQEILNARPYAFLDDGDAENRRTMAVSSGPRLDVADAARLRQLDAAALQRVREEAWPAPRDADEAHDALCIHGYLTAAEVERDGLVPLLRTLAAGRRATRAELAAGGAVWVAAERLARLRAACEIARLEPEIEAIDNDEDGDPLRELLRGRLEALGPVHAGTLAAELQRPEPEVEAALCALEQEGFAMRGAYEGDGEQWCERRLLARIHRYGLERQRARVRPVSPQVFQRFLLRWQGVVGERPEGPDALLAAMGRLEGYSAPAAVWEAELLPARIALYSGAELDALGAAGKLSWARLNPRRGGARASGVIRQTPIAFCPRERLNLWRAASAPADVEALTLSSNARQTLAALQSLGASFFSDLVSETGLLRAQMEEALGELVAWGLVHADTFAGLRSLISPSRRRPRNAPRTRRRRPLFEGIGDAGRWSRLQPVSANATEALEHQAWALLSRYGVVFRKLLEREARPPPWRDLLRCYWRLEARGEIRGGRFVEGFSGEQFALPEAEDALRAATAGGGTEQVVLSAADPASLAGIISPGERLSGTAGNRVLYVDGLARAQLAAGDVSWAPEVSPPERERLLAALLAVDARPSRAGTGRA